jgi:hypothetical protein
MMKKNCIKATVSLLLAATAIAFTSCQGIIFSTIRDEVKLVDSQVSGDINALVRCNFGSSTEYLYASNGRIWRKDVTKLDEGQYNGMWTETAKPAGTIYKLAADATTLYAVSVVYYSNDDDGENEVESRNLYYSADGTNWTQITADSSSTAISLPTSTSEIVTVFCTNAPISANRSAYFNNNGVVYKLSAGTATKIYDSSDSTDTSFTTHGGSSGAKCAAYFNSTVYFNSTYAMTTNEVSGQYRGVADTAASYIYFGSSDNLYYSDGTSDASGTCGLSWTSYDLNCGSIYSIAVTTDEILLGTSSGIEKVTNTSGVPGSSTGSFSTNADSTLSSYYEVWNILALDQGLSETGGDLYGTTVFTGSTSSTSATFSNVGLWAYYPARGNWNRE